MLRRPTPFLILLMACQSGGSLHSTNASTEPARASPDVIAAPAPTPVPAAPGAPDPKAVAAVEATVQANNAASTAEREHFAAEGWTIVDGIPAPDQRVLAYDAVLIGSDPDALRAQLASTTPTSADLEQVTKIAKVAQSPELRLTAIEAIGRMRSEASQAALVDLLTSGVLTGDEAARMTAAPLVRPRDLDDPGVGAAAALLDSPQLGEVEKNQIAFTLSAIALRDGTEMPASVLAALSDSAKMRLKTMRSIAQN